jgi:hypothetical protein
MDGDSPRTAATGSLHAWGQLDSNGPLLLQYFQRRPDAPDDVVVLLTTAEELRRIIADGAANAQEAISAFLQTMGRAVSRDGRLLPAAKR